MSLENNPHWIEGIHHVAIIVGDYEVSRSFYVELLGCTVLDENHRADRESWKLDLALPGGGRLELFSFPGAPNRPSAPEAIGLRHLAFATGDLDAALARLTDQGVICEPVRVDPYTGKRFTFFRDPDDLPLEIYELDGGNAVRPGRTA